MSNSVQPHRWQPTRLPRPWDSPGKNTGVGCHFLLQCMKVKSESEVAQSCPTLATPWTAAHQAPPSMGFSRQEYWSGVPLPSPNGILLSYKKECIWVSSNEVDEPGAYYTEWSKPEREIQILYINTYIYNVERWYQQSYMHGSKEDTDVKNRLLDWGGKDEGGIIWENSIETCTLLYVK